LPVGVAYFFFFAGAFFAAFFTAFFAAFLTAIGFILPFELCGVGLRS
jgi:hypothetical protein